MTDPRLCDPASVQMFLNDLFPGEEFQVIFLTNKGEQREYFGQLDPKAKRSSSVPIMTNEGWKTFNINQVLSIRRVE